MFPQPWVPTQEFPIRCQTFRTNTSARNWRNWASLIIVEGIMWAGTEDLVKEFRVNVLGLRKIRKGDAGWSLLLDWEVLHSSMWSKRGHDLLAGKPTFLVPFSGDQPFWGWAVNEKSPDHRVQCRLDEALVGKMQTQHAQLVDVSLTANERAQVHRALAQYLNASSTEHDAQVDAAVVDAWEDTMLPFTLDICMLVVGTQQDDADAFVAIGHWTAVRRAVTSIYKHLPVNAMACDLLPHKVAAVYDRALILKMSYEAAFVAIKQPDHRSLKYTPVHYSMGHPPRVVAVNDVTSTLTTSHPHGFVESLRLAGLSPQVHS
ncbi:hypothetical protein B5M09_001831 [Aphanomyces astaci]|uniref:Uncharacterized protein n=1 Tax=Aphanomyces astaci TaxID=112090 RepID=A0A425D109_APHAT|nr:hypothetical protein B5M09_001831 [Aphanomyces astaci]